MMQRNTGWTIQRFASVLLVLFTLICNLGLSAFPDTSHGQDGQETVADEGGTGSGTGVANVGMPAQFQSVVIPGEELIPQAFDEESPLTLRIEEVYPHGTDFRYDFEVIGREPGKYDLRAFLQTKTGEPADQGEPIMFTVIPLLSSEQSEPNALSLDPSPAAGSYRMMAWTLGIVWFLGFVVIICSFFWGGKSLGASQQRPLTLADELRVLISEALQDRGSPRSMARVEMLLLAHWRDRLGLQNTEAHEAIRIMHDDPAAGALLRQIEAQLHQPNPDPNFDWETLLKPYQHTAAEIGGTP